jgi:predicted nucleic acid-binding protein
VIFCDTSFAAKLYALEPETAVVRQAIDEADQVFVSDLFRVELMSVFHRRMREGLWMPEDFRTAIEQFQRDDLCGFWTWLPLERKILQAAEQVFTTLPPSTFLRAADCIHLVTALYHGFGIIHTFDQHQAQAAQVLGLRAASV